MRWEDVTVIVATGLAWWSLIPQIRRLARTGDPEGISTTWPAIGLVSNAAWTAYLLSQELWAAAPSTAVMVVFYVLVLRALHRVGSPLGTAGGRGVAWAATLTVILTVGSWPWLGLALGWAYILQLAPAVVAAYRSPDPTGISAGTWVMIGLEASLWLAYGLFHADLPLLVYASVGMGSAALILVRVAWTRNVSSRPPALR